MEKIKIIQEAFEKAKELYWKEGKSVCIGMDLWKFSEGTEQIGFSLWVDEAGSGKMGNHIFKSESFQELLNFLGIKEPEGDPKFTTFGGAPKKDAYGKLGTRNLDPRRNDEWPNDLE